MNREAAKILAQINAQKEVVKNYVAADKLEEAKEAKKELDRLQAKFELIKDLDDEAGAAAGEQAAAGQVKNVVTGKGYSLKEKARAFVNVLKAGITRTPVAEEDMKIINSMNESEPDGETGLSEGGLTVPEDMRTEIMELKRTVDDLEQYVNVEPVSTLSGSRVIEEDADATPWDNVDEEAAFPDAETPKFLPVKYKVTKKGGILKLTEELFRDTAENILAYLKKYIAKKTRATRNAFILKKIDEITAGKEVDVTDIDGLKDIFNEQIDPALLASSRVITNQKGFNWLDKLKDQDGNYILQPDPTQPTRKLLFGSYPVVVVKNKTMKNTTVEGGVEIPMICGDTKEAITLFDREYMSIEISNQAGDLWNKDQTGVKVRDRFDVQATDENAIVKAKVTVANAG